MKSFLVRNFLVLSLAGASLAAAAACSSDLQPPTATLTAVSASVAVGAHVALDGSASKDPNSLALSYQWTIAAAPAGSHAELMQTAGAFPWFTADLPGDYTVKLVVSDGVLSSAAALATVHAGPCGANAPTITTVSSTPATPGVGSAVQLSADPKDADTDAACTGGDRLTYAWSIDALPAGSKASLNDAAATNPSFIADVPGAYVVTLTVTDLEGSKATKSATVTVGACGTNSPALGAVTASNATPKPGDAITVTTTATDADQGAPCSLTDPLALHWAMDSVPAGSHATISDPTQSSPWFRADVSGDYTVGVYATDAAGHQSPRGTVKVTASVCGTQAPIARVDTTKVKFGNCQAFNNQQQQNCSLNNTSVGAYSPSNPNYTIASSQYNDVQLDGSLSSDPDNGNTCNLGQTLSYTWTVLSAPISTQPSFYSSNNNNNNSVSQVLVSNLSNPTLRLDRNFNNNFNNNLAGSWVVQLVVSDGTYSSPPTFIKINAQ